MIRFVRETARKLLSSVEDRLLVRNVRRARLTYLSDEKLMNLMGSLEDALHRDVPGDVVEAGVALGGSAIILSRQMMRDSGERRSFYGYDVFDMIPPPSERDDEKSHERYETIRSGESKGIGGEGEYYGYVDDLYGRVVSHFDSFGLVVDDDRIHLLRGLFEDTMNFEEDQAIAFAHIDCDWHDPVDFCLRTIEPHLSPGGYIVIDDYNDYGGCRKATDRFLEDHPDIVLLTADSNAVLHRPA